MAGEVTRALHTRLGVARLLLQEASRDPQQREIISGTQTEAVAQLISKLPVIDVETRADLLAAIMRTSFTAKDTSTLNSLLMQPRRIQKPGWQMQNYENVTEYFSESEWKVMLSGEVASSVKLKLILDRLHMLGCDRPSEATIKRVVVFHLLVSDGVERAAQMGAEKIKLLMQNVRSDIKRYKRGMPAHAMASGPTLLPPNTVDFFGAAEPELYKKIYGADDPPVPSKLSRDLVAQCEQGFRCRGGDRMGSVMGSQMQLSRKSSVPDITTALNLRDMGSMFMSSMEKMQQSQMQMQQQQIQLLQMALHGPGHGALETGGVGSKSVIANGSMRMMEFGTRKSSSSTALIAGGSQAIVEEINSQEADASPMVQPGAIVPYGTHMAADNLLQPPPADNSRPHDGTLQRKSDLVLRNEKSSGALATKSMLELLARRDAAAKEARKAEKRSDDKVEPASSSATIVVKKKKTKKKKKSKKVEGLDLLRADVVVADAPKKRGRPRKHVPTPTTVKELPNRKSGKKAGGKSGKKGSEASSKKGSKASSTKTAASPKKPHWHVEWSRSQIMCRTGESGPNTTMRILFGPGHISYQAAEKMANTWLKKQLKARGLS